MKTPKRPLTSFTIGIFLIAMVISCSNPNSVNIDTPTPEIDKTVLTDDIAGSWIMVAYVAFLPSLPVIEENEIIWTVDLDNEKLMVQNSIESAYPYILPSGVYSISVNEVDKIITISSTEYDYTQTENSFTISDHPKLDGPTMYFKRD